MGWNMGGLSAPEYQKDTQVQMSHKYARTVILHARKSLVNCGNCAVHHRC